MRPNRWCALLLILALILSSWWFARPAASQRLFGRGIFQSVLKIGGVALVISKWGGDINSFLNKVLAERRAGVEGKTKVVEILRVGGAGAAVGAAQVAGTAYRVDKVQAVAEIEVPFGRFRARGLLPISTKKAITKNIGMVGGTGVSANIKFPL